MWRLLKIKQREKEKKKKIEVPLVDIHPADTNSACYRDTCISIPVSLLPTVPKVRNWLRMG